MSHQDLFTAVLSLEKPLLTSLTAASAVSSSPILTPISSSSSSKSSKSSSTSKSSKSKSSKSRRPSISSDSDSSFSLHPPSFTQRKRKYDDVEEISGDTPLNKKLRRQQQNRQAAHTSRIKKKLQMDALQKQVTDLIAANRLLQEKVSALQHEVSSNRALLQSEETQSHISIDTPISHDSPISITSTSPESPISPIPITMKSPISPLSDSDTSMDISTSSSTSTSLPSSQLLSPSLPLSTTSPSTSPSTIEVISSSTRCYEPAAFELSPQCQQMENGMTSMIQSSSLNSTPTPHLTTPPPPLTWSQFTMILSILNTVWSMIQSSKTNTFHLKIPSLQTSLIHPNPIIQVQHPSQNQTSTSPHPIQNQISIHHPLTSRMSGIEIDTNTNLMSNLCAIMVIMAMSRVTQQSTTTVS